MAPLSILFEVQRRSQSLYKILLGNVNARALPTRRVPNQLTRTYIQALHVLTKGRPDLNTPELWEGLDEKPHGPGPLLTAAKCPVLISLKTTVKLPENNPSQNRPTVCHFSHYISSYFYYHTWPDSPSCGFFPTLISLEWCQMGLGRQTQKCSKCQSWNQQIQEINIISRSSAKAGYSSRGKREM